MPGEKPLKRGDKLEQLLFLAQQQREAVDRGDYEEAVDIASRRSLLIEAIEAEGLDSDDVDTLRRIREIDSGTEKMIRERLAEIGARAADNRRGKKALAAYFHKTSEERFIDRQK